MSLIRALPDLLAAERALARLDLALSDTGRRHRYRHDAARRAALALISLDGGLVAEGDLLVALASPGDVPISRRPAALRAAGLVQLLTDLQDGLEVTPTAANPTRPRRDTPEPAAVDEAWKGLSAAIWQDLRRAEEALKEAEPEESVGPLDAPTGTRGPQRLTPWSVDWVEAIYRRWHVVLLGSEPEPFEAERTGIIAEVLVQIDQALVADPGLLGVARVLHRLHWLDDWPEPARPAFRDGDEDNRNRALREHIQSRPKPAWWPWFARLVAPLLMQRACHLGYLWLPLPCLFAVEAGAFRAGIAAGESDWVGRFSRWMATFAEREDERAERIERRFAELRQRALQPAYRPLRAGAGSAPYRSRQRTATTRRSTSRMPGLVDFLAEQPVVSAAQVQKRLGIAVRNALILIQDLERLGLLREVTGRGAFRLWRFVPV